MKIERFSKNPIIHPGLSRTIGANINGPSLIRVPGWISDPPGKYYLYFAHHKGDFIRLAFADRLEGPWRIHEPGTLHLADSYFVDHIASPDVHMDNEKHEIRMYYHGQVPGERQRTRVAVSTDGIRFQALPEILAGSYLRVFRWSGYYYALGMPGIFYRAKNAVTGFERGPVLFSQNMRHAALRLKGATLQVFYSNAGDAPERILLSTIDLTPDWMQWKESPAVTILEPEYDYEGVKLPLVSSERGWAPEPVRQLRDPCIYQESNETYLLYSVAGEQGIAIARLID